ncbi:hypothetical protein N657DRAFT_415444 [Parathielavia appendiculata]|uniref:Uncharacterized protein n=1 Tax=Parathielavia appendiculata TaxID=2587402 RepID=A0AAN6TZS8_9PEZI|nr:hypothetical protein N657DRAFT_415444 [Parathielavia appendiculata]
MSEVAGDTLSWRSCLETVFVRHSLSTEMTELRRTHTQLARPPSDACETRIVSPVPVLHWHCRPPGNHHPSFALFTTLTGAILGLGWRAATPPVSSPGGATGPETCLLQDIRFRILSSNGRAGWEGKSLWGKRVDAHMAVRRGPRFEKTVQTVICKLPAVHRGWARGLSLAQQRVAKALPLEAWPIVSHRTMFPDRCCVLLWVARIIPIRNGHRNTDIVVDV